MLIRKAVLVDVSSINAKVFSENADLGLKCFHWKNADFAVAFKMISALAFIPAAEVEKAFELLVEEILHVFDKLKADTSVLEKTDQLGSYFKSTYRKGEQLGGTGKTPLSP